MNEMISANRGEIIEQPLASEVYERLPEPKNRYAIGDYNKAKKWIDRVNVARKIRDEKLKHLNKYIRYYEGDHWQSGDDVPSLSDKSMINLVFANIKNELPNLYFQNPAPIVNAGQSGLDLQAFAMQKILDHYRKYNLRTSLKKHVRLAILDAKFTFGCLKVTYTPRFGPNPNANLAIIEGYDSFGEPVFAVDDEGNVVTESDEILTSELYYIERISPREVLVDAECRNFPERAKWIGHEIVKPLSYLKKNGLYKNTATLSRNIELSEVFQKTFNKSTPEIQASRELSDSEDTDRVRFVEIHDLENNELLVLPDNTDYFIREEKIYLNPFSFLKFNESPDNFYSVPDIKQEIPIQQEINIGASMQLTHARRAARKYAYSDDSFRGIDDIEGKEAMKNPDDMSLFKVADLDQIPRALEMATQDPAIFQNLIRSFENYNRVSGSTESQRGASERRKTKGEATFQEGHLAVRKGDKQSLVADFIVDTYKNLGQLMQVTLTIPQAVKIIGNSGIFWTQVSKKDVQGELFYDIEVSDLRPQIPELDRQELSEFIFALSNFLNAVFANPVGPMVFNLQGLIKEFAKSYPSIRVENILNGNITPEQIANMVTMQMQGGGNANL